MFGFLELEDDPEVAAARCSRPRRRGCARSGRDHMVGPMDFTMNDESGVMIEGFEREPMIQQPWHPPYYQRRCEEAGLAKAMDLLMWELDISDREQMLPIIFKLAEQLEERHGVHAPQDVAALAAQATWTASPRSTTRPGARTGASRRTTKKDLDAYAQEMQLVFDPHWFMVAETPEGETVGGRDHGARHQPGAARR